jgi:hypothetical protein
MCPVRAAKWFRGKCEKLGVLGRAGLSRPSGLFLRRARSTVSFRREGFYARRLTGGDKAPNSSAK